MRFVVLLVFASLIGFSCTTKVIETGARRTVPEIAANFETLEKQTGDAKRNPGIKPFSEGAPASGTGTDTVKATKSVAKITDQFTTAATPKKSTSDAEVWKLLQAKQRKLRKYKQKLLKLIRKRYTLLKKQGKKAVAGPDVTQDAILRAINMNLAYKPSTAEIKQPLTTLAVPVNNVDAALNRLLQAKQTELRRLKQELLDLIKKHHELLKKRGKARTEIPTPDGPQAAILRAIDLNLAYYKP